MTRTYKSIIDSAINSVYRAGIANKILQHMDRIRNVNDEGQARRWVMELLQNCGDTAYENKPVSVRITLDNDKLVFAHNGRPFKVKDILSIINQVSSKSPDENTVGRFGTGFMSTFRLSEEVTIKSVLRDTITDESGESIFLPYRSFSVTLDRKGHTKEEVNISFNCVGDGSNAEKFGYYIILILLSVRLITIYFILGHRNISISYTDI